MTRPAALVPYMRDLRSIRGALERELGHAVGFPGSWCTAFSRLLESECGLEYCEGIYMPGGHPHAWNRDARRGVDIDLSAGQFDRSSPDVLVLPVGNATLLEGEGAHESGPLLSQDLERMIATRMNALDPAAEGGYSSRDASALYGRIMRTIRGPAERIRRYVQEPPVLREPAPGRSSAGMPGQYFLSFA